jgi:hypothetical protein
MSIMNDYDIPTSVSSGPRGRSAAARFITLDHAASLTLDADRSPRVLRVEQGRIWLTRTRDTLPGSLPRSGAGELDPGATDGRARDTRDLWLAPGETLALPGGSRWVLQAWPEAQLQLQADPGRCDVADSGCPGRGVRHTGWAARLARAARQVLPHALHKARAGSVDHTGGLSGAGCS